jgi:hypothetical protein
MGGIGSVAAHRDTIYLMSIPGMAESIREGMATPLEECVEELDWEPGPEEALAEPVRPSTSPADRGPLRGG